MHNYPSDISRDEFEIIKEELEGAKKKTRPRQTDFCFTYAVDRFSSFPTSF